jgi:hypothetical protein
MHTSALGGLQPKNNADNTIKAHANSDSPPKNLRPCGGMIKQRNESQRSNKRFHHVLLSGDQAIV